MKVILTDEVIGLGESGKLVDVAPGYARNFLVPRKLAVYADTGKLKELEHNTRRLERRNQKLQAAAQTTAQRVSSQAITLEVRAGQGGKLFGAITSRDIAEALEQQLGVVIDRRKIHLEPIHAVGSYTADLHLLGETHAQITVVVRDTSQPIAVETPATADLQPEPPATPETDEA